MSNLINLGDIGDIGPVQFERYPHGGGRVWRKLDNGGCDLVLDLYGPAERRDAIIEKLSDAHAATVAALEERVKLLEGLLNTAMSDDCISFDLAERIEAALAPTEEGGRDA